jgi:signal transduction histidine kinase
MSSYESIYKKMATSLEQNSDGSLRETTAKYDPTRHIAPVVAHELNNILTIVQGYTERLLLHHGGDPALAPHLRLISEASKRAATIVRAATPTDANNMFRKQQNSGTTQVAV